MIRHITEDLEISSDEFDETDETNKVTKFFFKKGNVMSAKHFLQNYMSFVAQTRYKWWHDIF